MIPGWICAILMAFSLWAGFRFGHVAGHLHEKQENCDHVWEDFRPRIERCARCMMLRRVEDEDS